MFLHDDFLGKGALSQNPAIIEIGIENQIIM